jgi:putative membrane protein
MADRISKAERDAIRAAIKAAEKRTNAEIFAVFAERSDDYRHVAALLLAFWIFLASFVLAMWAHWQGFALPAAILSAGGLAAFLSGYVLFSLFPRLAILLTPHRLLRERAHRNATHQFLAHGVDHTSGRSGVLVFVSLEERFAEVMVDSAIEAKLGRDPWFEVVKVMVGHCREGRLAEAYLEAIPAIADRLEAAFPPGSAEVNELDDKLVII